MRDVDRGRGAAPSPEGEAGPADSPTGDGLTVSIVVAVDPGRAFQAFTGDIDRWWLRGPKHRFREPYHDGFLRFDTAGEGRLVEHYPDGSSFTVGRILRWIPGEILHLTWRLPNFAPDESTEVVVTFAAVAGGTRVSVEHRGWDALREDHPALHGRDRRTGAFATGRLWMETLTAFRNHLIGGDR